MHIDWARVKELKDEIGEEDFDEVADLFLEEVSGAVQAMEASSDPAGREADLHFIKGSSQNLGFKSLADLCAQWEVNSRNGQAADVPITQIRSLFDQCLAEFQATNGSDQHAA